MCNNVVKVGAQEVKTQRKSDSSNNPITVKLYFGIFFDGTRNNKVQALIGRYFRRKSVYVAHKSEFESLDWDSGSGAYPIYNLQQFSRLSRSEMEKYPFIKKAELDQVFGAAEKIYAGYETGIVGQNDESRQSTASESLTEDVKTRAVQMARSEEASGGIVSGISQAVNDFLISKGSQSQNSFYTNPSILESLYNTTRSKQGKDYQELYYCYYSEGAGADTNYNAIYRATEVSRSLYGALGGVGDAGVCAKCRNIAELVKRTVCDVALRKDVHEIQVTFDVFGFSRGAAAARMFTYLVNPKGEYKLTKEDNKLFSGSEEAFLPLKKDKSNLKIKEKKVRLLGLFDTVSSIGALRDPFYNIVADTVRIHQVEEFKDGKRSAYHDCNVDDFGLYATESADSVLHLCAMDEFRANYALVDIQSSISGRNGTELFLPGSHSDIGGGGSFGRERRRIIKDAAGVKLFTDLAVRLGGTAKASRELMKSLVAANSVLLSVGELSLRIGSLFSPLPGAGLMSFLPWTNNPVNQLMKSYEKVKSSFRNARSQIQKSNEEARRIEDSLRAIAAEDLGSGSKSVRHDPAFKEQVDAKNNYDSTMKSLNEFKASSSVESFEDFEDRIGSYERQLEEASKANTLNPGQYEDVKNLLEDIKNGWSMLWDTINRVKSISTTNPFRLRPDREVKFFNTYPFVNVMDDSMYRLNVSWSSLLKMGWASNNAEDIIGRIDQKTVDESFGAGKSVVFEDFDSDEVGLSKYTTPGYSNLSLKLMWEWSQMKTQSEAGIFRQYPESMFPVPKDLTDFYTAVARKVFSTGRFFCTPKYPGAYQKLRDKFLKFTMDQGDTSFLTDGPSLAPVGDDAVITRRIYVGSKGSATAGNSSESPKKKQFLFQYKNSPDEEGVIICPLEPDKKMKEREARKQDIEKEMKDPRIQKEIEGRVQKEMEARKQDIEKEIEARIEKEMKDPRIQKEIEARIEKEMKDPRIQKEIEARVQKGMELWEKQLEQKRIRKLQEEQMKELLEKEEQALSPQIPSNTMVPGNPASGGSLARPKGTDGKTQPSVGLSGAMQRPARGRALPQPQPVQKSAQQANWPQPQPVQKSAPQANRPQPKAPPKPAALSSRPQPQTTLTSTPQTNRPQPKTTLTATLPANQPQPQVPPKPAALSSRPQSQARQGSGRALPMKPGQAPSSGLLKKK